MTRDAICGLLPDHDVFQVDKVNGVWRIADADGDCYHSDIQKRKEALQYAELFMAIADDIQKPEQR